MPSGPTQTAADTRTASPETADDTADVGAAPSATGPTVDGRARAELPPEAPPEGLQVREPRRYQMVDEHGRGGLGRVMRAVDSELGRTVAIKELLRRGRAAEVRFLREALITARLEHPSIVPVHEAGRWPDGTPFYSMKLVAGRQLRELIEEAETLEQRLALVPHLVAVADAIAYAHARRIVHRDLKPANVIVGEYGETVVIDWGLAKDLSTVEHEPAGEPYRAPVAPDDVTIAGTVMGTPAYMAPEQARGDAGDELSDVYSLGAMLYSVLTRRVPYQGSRSADVVRAVVEGPPAPVPAVVPGVAADLVAIVTAAMHRDRDLRLPSARAFADELRRYLDGRRVRSHRYTAAERALRWMRRHRELSAAVAVATAVLLALGGVAISRIVDERNAADQQRQRAESALAEARDQRDRLVLRNARVANDRDPTAALATLATYQGKDTEKAQELAAIAVARNAATFARVAEAKIRGAAAVSFSPPVVIGAGPDRVVRMWRADETAPTTIPTSPGPAIVVMPPEAEGNAFADGTSVVSLAADGTRRVRATLSAPVSMLLFTDDGEWLLAGANNGDLRLLGADSEHQLALPAAAANVGSGAISANAEAIVICTMAGQLWDFLDGRWRQRGTCAREAGSLIALSDSGRWLASLVGRTLEMRDLQGSNAPSSTVLPGTPTNLTFLADDSLIVGDSDGAVHAVDTATRATRRLVIGTSAVTRISERPGGDIAIGFQDGEVRIVSPSSGHVERLAGLRYNILRLQWSADGRRLFAADTDGFRIWPIARLDVVNTGSAASHHLVYSSDGSKLAVDTFGSAVLLVDRHLAAPVQTLNGHTRTATTLVFTETTLLSGAADGHVLAWNLADGSARRALDGTSEVVASVASLRGGAYVVDAAGRLFEVDAPGTSRPLATIPGRVLGLQLTTSALLVHEEHAIHAIDVRTRAKRVLDGHNTAGYAFATSRDGDWYVRGTIDGAIEMRTVAGDILHSGQYQGRCSRAAIASTGDVAVACSSKLVTLRRGSTAWTAATRELETRPYSLAFSPDGRYLSIGGHDGLVYLFDQRTGGLAARQVVTGTITSLAFAPDGTELAATTASPEVHRIAPAAQEFVPAAGLRAWIAARIDIPTPHLDAH